MVLALERNCRPLGLFGETAPQTPLLLLQGRMENKWITSPPKYGISNVLEGEEGDPVAGKWNYSTLGSPELV